MRGGEVVHDLAVGAGGGLAFGEGELVVFVLALDEDEAEALDLVFAGDDGALVEGVLAGGFVGEDL